MFAVYPRQEMLEEYSDETGVSVCPSVRLSIHSIACWKDGVRTIFVLEYPIFRSNTHIHARARKHTRTHTELVWARGWLCVMSLLRRNEEMTTLALFLELFATSLLQNKHFWKVFYLQRKQ